MLEIFKKDKKINANFYKRKIEVAILAIFVSLCESCLTLQNKNGIQFWGKNYFYISNITLSSYPYQTNIHINKLLLIVGFKWNKYKSNCL